MRLLFRPHSVGSSFIGVVEASLLSNLSARFNDSDMPFDFVLQRQPDKAEGVDVLDFSLGAKLFLPARTHTDVGVAAKRALLHVAIADAGIEDDLLHPRQVFVSLVRRPYVRFADDFSQRHA